MAVLIEAQRGQSVLDLAVQHYGSVEGVIDLVQRNPGLIAIERNAEAGQRLWIGEPVNQRVVDQMAERGYVPATAADVFIPGDFNIDFNEDFNI